jgi:dolichol kinase
MTSDARFSEDARQSVHIAMGGFALLLPLLPWWQSTVLATFAVLFNLFALQKVLGRRLFRPGERVGRLTSGIVLYPLTVLLLLLIFSGRLDIVAASWGILAVGDGMATIVGRRFPITRLPWNQQKSLGGTLAFAVCGAAAGIALGWWCRDTVVPPAYTWFYVVAPVLAAFAAAAVETIPISLDDNVSVAASAAGAMWVISLISNDLIAAVRDAGMSAVFIAGGANVLVAMAGYAAGTVTIPGMIAGAGLGTAIFFFAGAAGWALLLLCFAIAVVTSRMGLARKRRLGIAEERGADAARETRLRIPVSPRLLPP